MVTSPKRTIIQPVLPGLPDGLLVPAIDESNRLTSSDITCGQHEQGHPHANRLVFNYAGRLVFVGYLSNRPEQVFWNLWFSEDDPGAEDLLELSQ